MLFSVHERFNSREVTTGKNKSTDLLYVILGTPEAGDDEVDLDAAALAALTAVVANTLVADGETLVRTKRHVEAVHVWDVDEDGEPAGTMVWDGSASYERFNRTPPETGDSSYSFDTTGGSQHIMQAIEHIADYPAGTKHEYKGAINVQRDGESLSVEGVDITVPVFSWTETHYLSNATVTDAYKLAVFGLTGRTNNAIFHGFQIGEVLFLGVTGSQRGTEDWELTFHFAASLNRTNFAISTITGINKKGWEYMWVTYEDSVNTDVVVKQPVAVHIERVYESGDFVALGI